MSGIAAIGNTPVVQLERLVDDDFAEVWVKLEAANPTGSYKDRMALAMIEAAERDGRLQPGQTVVECTGGSTGSSLAFVCAVKDYPLRIVSSDAFAAEKILTMQAFGADVELIPSPAGITPDLIPTMIRRAGEIAAEVGGFWTNQFQNDDMIDGYRRLGQELPGAAPRAAGHRRVVQLRGNGGLLLGHDPGAARAAAGAVAGGGGTGRVGGAVGPGARHPSHRGGRDRVLAAETVAGGHRSCDPRA